VSAFRLLAPALMESEGGPTSPTGARNGTRTDGARAIGADAESLRLVGAAAKVPASAASYGVVDNDRQILQH
jgi:hypothetical protein